MGNELRAELLVYSRQSVLNVQSYFCEIFKEKVIRCVCVCVFFPQCFMYGEKKTHTHWHQPSTASSHRNLESDHWVQTGRW